MSTIIKGLLTLGLVSSVFSATNVVGAYAMNHAKKDAKNVKNAAKDKMKDAKEDVKEKIHKKTK